MTETREETPEPPTALPRWMPRSVGYLRPFISFRAVATLSVSSLLFGLAEAATLVLVARIAFALSEGLNEISADVFGFQVSASIAESLLLTLSLVVVRGGLQVLTGWQSSHIVSSTLARVRKRMAGAYLRTSWEVQSQEPPGRLQELLTSFVTSAGSVVDAITKGITSVFSLIALLVTALLVSPLAAIGFAGTAVVLGLTLRPLRNVLLSTSRRLADSSLGLAGGISELSAIGREVQVFDVVDPVADQIDELVDNSARATQRQSFLGFLFTPAYTTVMLLLLVLALVAVRLTGATDLEQLSAVMLVMLRSLAYGQLAQAVFGTLQSTVPFTKDLYDQLSAYELERVDSHSGGLAQRGIIEFHSVSYAYPSRPSVPAVHPLTFRIQPGELVGIIGPSGSGKSTLVQLLLRLRVPTDGVITLDGVDVRDLSLASWRSGVTFVPQEPRIIASTIADNIRFFRDADRGDIEAAARAAHIHDEISAMVDGYDTMLGSENAHLSGGQQQRLCIARALVTRPWMIVLDEPTSALDAFSEAGIRDTLAGLSGSVSTVVVAHRMSTVQQCDRIMVIQDGELAAFDKPSALLSAGGFYRDALEVSGVQ